MTIEEIQEFLANTKVYVNGESKRIQEKLFSFGYTWGSGDKFVQYTNDPFIFIHKDKCFTHNNDMNDFVNNEYTEILAEEILSLKLTEPTYRPFKTKDECWEEMQKHQPFGWLMEKPNKIPEHIQLVHHNVIFICNVYLSYEQAIKQYTFTDGIPFGILEN